MPINVVRAGIIIVCAYFTMILLGYAIYTALNADVPNCLMYSIDSLCSRGRYSDPKPIGLVAWCAAAQSVIGNLLVPLAMAMLFSSLQTEFPD